MQSFVEVPPQRHAPAELFTTTQVCRLTGISYRQCDYWIRTGVIVPAVDAHGPGTQRRFSGAQVDAIRVLARLRDAGLSLQRLRKLAGVLGEESKGWLVVPVSEDRPAAVIPQDDRLLGELGTLGAALVVELNGYPQASQVVHSVQHSRA